MNTRPAYRIAAGRRRVWEALTRNAADPADLQAHLNARLLAAMLPVFTLAFACVDIYQSITFEGYDVPWPGYLVLAGAFCINRVFSYRLAAVITCLMFPAVLFGMVISNPSLTTISSLNYLGFSILLATMLLRKRETIAYAALVLLLLGLLPVLLALEAFLRGYLVTPIAVSVFGAVLSLVFSRHRDLIEARRQAELAASESRYRQLVGNFRGIVYETVAGTFRPTLFEGAVREMTGYAPEYFVSGEIRWDEIVHPDDVAQLREEARERLLLSGPVCDSEYRIINARGGEVWVRDFGLHIRDEARGVMLCHGSIIDISETRRLQERLRHSEKMEAVGQLAGGVAHDFNNQLTGIMGFAELLRYEASGQPDLAHYADNIMVAARRASDLTNQLLAFARKGKYLACDIDLHRIILEVVTLLRHSIDKRIEIRQHLNADPPRMLGDPTQIQSALLNLALNACDAMGAAGVLTIATDIVFQDERWCNEQPYAVSPGAFVQVSVQDSGSGIPAADMPHLFEPFFTTKAPGKGTGMGLAAVYGTVKNHHGALTVQSTVGSGSIFTLYFPQREAAGVPEAGDGSGVKRQPASARVGRVLIVDDERLVREMAESMLGRMGHAVCTASNGREAVALYTQEHASIDVVLLDLAMPVMDGVEAFGRLRTIDAACRVIITSGFSKDGKAQELLQQGALGFVQKPFRGEELAVAIDTALRQGR